MSRVYLHFGALAKPIMQQLREQGISPRHTKTKHGLTHLQLDADALVRLAVRGYIPDAQRQRIHQRLMRQVVQELSRE
jgi:hypothetical protein